MSILDVLLPYDDEPLFTILLNVKYYYVSYTLATLPS